jgi:hypothetical protein
VPGCLFLCEEALRKRARMKVLAATAALLVAVWIVLKVALLAFRGLFHLLAHVLPFLLGATAACLLAAGVVKLGAWVVKVKRRRRPSAAPVGSTRAARLEAGLEGPVNQSDNSPVKRPVSIPPRSPEPRIAPAGSKTSGTSAGLGSATSSRHAPPSSPGQITGRSWPARAPETSTGRPAAARRNSGPARSAPKPDAWRASLAQPPADGSGAAITSLPAAPSNLPTSLPGPQRHRSVAPTSLGPTSRPRADGGPGRVILIEWCDGGQVGRGNDQCNAYRVSMPDITLISGRELAERLFGSGTPWSQDVFSHDAQPHIGGSGRVGFGASSSGTLAAPDGNTLVIVRNSRGIAIGDHGSQRNEFRIRVRAVKINATGLDVNSARRQAVERLRANPGDRDAARSLARDIADAAAAGLEVVMTAQVTRAVEGRQINGWPSRVDQMKAFQVGEHNRQRVIVDVNVSWPGTGRLEHVILDAARRAAVADRDLGAARPTPAGATPPLRPHLRGPASRQHLGPTPGRDSRGPTTGPDIRGPRTGRDIRGPGGPAPGGF